MKCIHVRNYQSSGLPTFHALANREEEKEKRRDFVTIPLEKNKRNDPLGNFFPTNRPAISFTKLWRFVNYKYLLRNLVGAAIGTVEVINVNGNCYYRHYLVKN